MQDTNKTCNDMQFLRKVPLSELQIKSKVQQNKSIKYFLLVNLMDDTTLHATLIYWEAW